MLSAGLMILLVLPLIGFTLSNAFEQKLTQSIQRELSAYSYAILALAEVEDNQLLMPEQLLENQFNVAQSGLYATISKHAPIKSRLTAPLVNKVNSFKSSTLWQSNSLLGMTAPNKLVTPEVGQTDFSRKKLTNLQSDENNHFVYSITVSFTTYKNNVSNDFPITINIIKSLTDFEQVLAQFQQQLWSWLLVLMLLLVIVQVFWLLWTLKPLRELKQELQDVEQGNLLCLEKNYPVELSQVTNQLNLLLATEQGQRKRYRNALADLAHSLKTPLAVIQSQSELNDSSQQQLGVINNIIEHQLKRAQSAGESSWHLGVNIDEVLDKLLNSLAKIYHDKSLSFNKIYPEKKDKRAIFKGDEADLLELLGNILDNACKAATSSVMVEVKLKNEALIITIADDGTGISDVMQEQILQRGMRADTYQQGHGIGLAIVRDLVTSYQGELNIGQSNQLGGAEFTLKFKVK